MLDKKPENAKEFFNLRRSSLRNAVERIFGVDKRRFKILNTPPEYDMATQVNLVLALTALHNFIKDHANQEIDYFEAEEDNSTSSVSVSDNLPLSASLATSTRMNRKRDAIANKMWIDYTPYISRHTCVI